MARVSALILRYRFDDEIIERMLEIECRIGMSIS